MFSSHSSCLTTKLNGPAVNVSCGACAISGPPFGNPAPILEHHHRKSRMSVSGRCHAADAATQRRSPFSIALRCRDPGDVEPVDWPGLKLGLAGWLTGATVGSAVSL